MEVRQLGFGLMRLPVCKDDPEKIHHEELSRMVDTFLEQGFNYFDTSYVYHGGKSEEAIRRALVERHDRSKFLLATKLPAFAITTSQEVEDIFEKQLERCGVDYFDYYLLHNLNDRLYETYVKSAKMFETVHRYKMVGRIRKMGFSFHDSPEVLDKILSEHPEVDFVQIVVNYYDWNSPYIQAKECYEVIRRHGKKVVVMEPVKGGMLAKVPKEAEEKMRQCHADWSAAEWALRFAASHPDVLTVLSGMSNLTQMQENTRAMNTAHDFQKEDYELLEEVVQIFQKKWKYPCGAGNGAVCLEQIPVQGLLNCLNSCYLQPNPFFAADLNYFRQERAESGKLRQCPSCAQCDKFSGDRETAEMFDEAKEFILSHGF